MMNSSAFAADVRVIDAGTLVVGGQMIRLEGISAPSLHQLCDNGGTKWACGISAANYLRSLTRYKRVTCKQIRKDIRGHVLAECYTSAQNKKFSLNAAMIRAGWAQSDRRSGKYTSLQNMASAQHKGLWARPRPAEMPNENRIHP